MHNDDCNYIYYYIIMMIIILLLRVVLERSRLMLGVEGLVHKTVCLLLLYPLPQATPTFFVALVRALWLLRILGSYYIIYHIIIIYHTNKQIHK